jgi:arginine decarboxylase
MSLPTARIGEQTLTIALSTGTGSGPTPLSAFDAALCAAGVGEYNLVRLSSVIPPHSCLVRSGAQGQLTGRWGDRLFCVYASQLAELAGEQAWAGIGWVLRQDGSGAGLFVEHEGPASSACWTTSRAASATWSAARRRVLRAGAAGHLGHLHRRAGLRARRRRLRDHGVGPVLRTSIEDQLAGGRSPGSRSATS